MLSNPLCFQGELITDPELTIKDEQRVMPEFPALLVKSRSDRSSLLPGKAQRNTIMALLSADVGPWLATLRGEGVERIIIAPTPIRDLSCCERETKLTSCSQLPSGGAIVLCGPRDRLHTGFLRGRASL